MWLDMGRSQMAQDRFPTPYDPIKAEGKESKGRWKAENCIKVVISSD